jgi:peroxiredoxin Q/BCP
VAKKLGVPVSSGGEAKVKDADGNQIVLKRGVTAQRWTLVIGKDGKVVYKAKVEKPGQDSKQILQVIEKQNQ